jgi:hypothetical protein
VDNQRHHNFDNQHRTEKDNSHKQRSQFEKFDAGDDCADRDDVGYDPILVEDPIQRNDKNTEQERDDIDTSDRIEDSSGVEGFNLHDEE